MLDWNAWIGSLALPIAVIAAIVGAVFLIHGLWGDRSRGARRCPRCWHDLSGTPSMVCGECGFTARSESDLHRARRRWSLAGAGLLLMLVGVAGIESSVGQRDLWRYVPGRVLVALLPWDGGTGGPNSLAGELRLRLGRGELGDGSLEALVGRIVEGDAEARASSAAWEAKYASLMSNGFLASVAERPALQERLRTIPPRLEVSIASPWPSDLPLYGTLDLDHWWAEPIQLRATIDCPEQPELGRVSVGFDTRGASWRRGWSRFPLEFANPPAAEGSLEVRVRLERREAIEADPSPESLAPAQWGPWVEDPALEQRVRVELELAEPIGDRLAPIDAPEIRAAIAEAFAPGLVVREEGPRPWAMRFDPPQTFIEELLDTALGFEVEVREGETVRRRTWIWWAAGPRGGPAEWRLSWEDAAGLSAASAHEPEEGRWTLRIRGDRALAQRAVEAVRAAGGQAEAFSKYWSGEIDVPLRIRRIPGAFPPRRWFDPDAPAAAGDPIATPSSQSAADAR